MLSVSHLPVVRPLQPLGVRAAVCAGRRAAGGAASCPSTWRTVGWILVAMVAARSAAMGFNRLVDARLDALNPRTADREIPRGAMTPAEATVFVVVSSRVFVFAAWRLESALLRAVAGRAGDRVLVFAGQAVSRPGRSCFSAWRWRSRRSAAGWRSAGGGAGSRGCSASRLAPGSAASTCCTRARTSSSIARTAAGRFRSASACPRAGDLARDACRSRSLPAGAGLGHAAAAVLLRWRRRVVALLLVYEQSLVAPTICRR